MARARFPVMPLGIDRRDQVGTLTSRHAAIYWPLPECMFERTLVLRPATVTVRFTTTVFMMPPLLTHDHSEAQPTGPAFGRPDDRLRLDPE